MCLSSQIERVYIHPYTVLCTGTAKKFFCGEREENSMKCTEQNILSGTVPGVPLLSVLYSVTNFKKKSPFSLFLSLWYRMRIMGYCYENMAFLDTTCACSFDIIIV